MSSTDAELHVNHSNMRRCGCGAGRGGRTALWGACGAELLGTALLVLLGCLPGALGAGPLHRALAAGLVVTALVQALDQVSGAMFNPVVLLAAVLWRRESWARCGPLLGAQLAGGALGAAGLAALRPGACAACLTLPAQQLQPYQAVLVEGALGAVLALANCGAWDERAAALRDSWPLRIGATVAAMSLVAGELTGASMNPARSFGPALVANVWTHHWVYWCAPLGGGLVATLTYRAAWRPSPRPSPRPVHRKGLDEPQA